MRVILEIKKNTVGKTRSSHHAEGVTSVCDRIEWPWTLRQWAQFKNIHVRRQFSRADSPANGRSTYSTMYITAGHAEEVLYKGSTRVSRTTTTWALRMQMERTASKYVGYLNVHWISRRGCRQGVALDQRLGREPVTDISESCYEMTGFGRALCSCLINEIQAWDLELGMSGSVAYELYYEGY
jgi:hypothetical protein